MQIILDNTCVVLVEPTHPGNIGAVARAMKTMGLNDLCLVKPSKFPHYEATKRAAGAEDVLLGARVVADLEAALANRTLVIGTSVREREVSWPIKTPRAAAEHIHAASLDPHAPIRTAIVFGRESSGLSNAELDLCDFQIMIPANPDYSSLNLASAVQIICYELRQAALHHLALPAGDVQLGDTELSSDEFVSASKLTAAQQRQLPADKLMRAQHIEHLQKVLSDLEFVKSKPPTMLIRKLTRLYNKAELSIEEIHILRGILTAVEQKLARN